VECVDSKIVIKVKYFMFYKVLSKS